MNNITENCNGKNEDPTNEFPIVEIPPEVIKTEIIKPNVSYANSLRLLADFYEKHEEMGVFLPELQMKIYGTSCREDLAICAKAFGSFKKEYTDDFFYMKKKFGDLTLTVAEYREKTCERVVVGTRKVIKEIPVETKMVEVDEEIVEWKCKETSLLAKNNEQIQITESDL